MHLRLLTGPITGFVLALAAGILLASTTPSSGVVGLAIVVCALAAVGVTVWSVLSDKARSQH